MRKRPDPISFQGATDAGAGGLEAMIAFEMPSVSLRTEMALDSQVKDLLYIERTRHGPLPAANILE
jgi:hypothetical protein